jgi:hypothetical protein
MLNVKYAFQSLLLVAMATALTACKNGGDLTLEPGARKDKALGSPYVQVNQGGKALIYEATLTPATATQGVHGWVTVQAITSSHLTSASGTNLIMNRPQSVP